MDIQEILICLLIIVLGAVEIGFYTVRVALTVKGNKLLVAIIAIINNLACLFCMALIVSCITTNPERAISYAIGTAIGSFLGIKLDQRFSPGSDFLSIIIDRKESDNIKKAFRQHNFDFIIIEGKGKDKDRDIFKIPIVSTRKKDILSIVNNNAPSAMIIDEVVNIQSKF